MNNVDMSKFVINKTAADADQANAATTGYGAKGEEVKADAKNCLAKEVRFASGIVKRYIKHPKNVRHAHITTRSAGRFVNPMTEDIGKPDHYEFRQVNEHAFAMYLKFLQTRNTDYLRHAERE